MGEPSVSRHCFESTISWFSFLSLSSAVAAAAAAMTMTYGHPARNTPSAGATACAWHMVWVSMSLYVLFGFALLLPILHALQVDDNTFLGDLRVSSGMVYRLTSIYWQQTVTLLHSLHLCKQAWHMLQRPFQQVISCHTYLHHNQAHPAELACHKSKLLRCLALQVAACLTCAQGQQQQHTCDKCSCSSIDVTDSPKSDCCVL